MLTAFIGSDRICACFSSQSLTRHLISPAYHFMHFLVFLLRALPAPFLPPEPYFTAPLAPSRRKSSGVYLHCSPCQALISFNQLRHPGWHQGRKAAWKPRHGRAESLQEGKQEPGSIISPSSPHDLTARQSHPAQSAAEALCSAPHNHPSSLQTSLLTPTGKILSAHPGLAPRVQAEGELHLLIPKKGFKVSPWYGQDQG